MLFIGSRKRRDSKEVASPELVQRIGSIDTYEGADEAEVERRLRSMTYGSTSSRIVKLRAGIGGSASSPGPRYLLGSQVSRMWLPARLDPAL